MSAEVIGWQEEHLLDHRRRLRNGLLVSLAIHGLFLAMLAISPSRSVPPYPDVLTVDLIAAPMAARPAPQAAPEAAPEPAPKPAPKAAPKPAPEPPPPAPPPIAKAPVQALPENAPSKIRKVEPRPKVDPRLRPREKELSYEDAMAALDDEVGPPAEDSDLLQPAPEVEPVESSGSPGRKSGVVVSREMLEWATKTTRKIQNSWKGTKIYEGRGLATTLEFELSASGDVLAEPRVLRSSGEHSFDDNAVRAVMMVSPLPAPPRAGLTVFVFRSEGD